MVEKFTFLIVITLFVIGYLKKQNKIRKLQIELRSCREQGEKWRRKALEEKSREDESDRKHRELLSIVATQTENAIMIMDPDGNIEWLNDGFTRMYGYDFDEFTKVRGSNIRQTSFSGIIDERLRRCKNSGEPVFYDAPNMTNDGREIWTRTTLTPIFDQEGQLTHLATIDTDIHRRKTAADVLLHELNILRERLNQLSEHQKKLNDVITRLLADQEKTSNEVKATRDIVKFINDVSDRIKIMGLNASIEAAGISGNGHGNANGAGQGFRVLSGEIIQMSEKTKVQSGKISQNVGRLSSSFDLIKKGKKEVEETTDQYYRIIQHLEEGLLKVEEVAEELNG